MTTLVGRVSVFKSRSGAGSCFISCDRSEIEMLTAKILHIGGYLLCDDS
jgi:hypothetical protein